MNIPSLRCLAVLLLLGFGLLCAKPAHANISCSNVSMSAVSFGNVAPQSSQTDTTATLSYTCTNNPDWGLLGGPTYSATICFSIGEPGGGATNPRLMSDGAGHTLAFQLYQDAARSQPWGSQFFGTFKTPLIAHITLGAGNTQTYTATLYGRVMNGQTTALPGSYSDIYQNGDTATTINQQQGGSAPSSCSGGQVSGLNFPFNVSASIPKQCTVTAGPTLQLGSAGGVDAGATNVSGQNTINVTCTSTTPYNVGLLPSNGNANGAGVMRGTGGNTDTVPYQLRQNSVTGPVWGNNVTASSTGNGVAGTGNGSAQSITVYAVAPNTDFRPDTYSDTVTVYVYY